MTRVARAHDDGKVIVPDEPLDLPVNAPLQIRCTRIQGEGGADESVLIEDRSRTNAWREDVEAARKTVGALGVAVTDGPGR